MYVNLCICPVPCIYLSVYVNLCICLLYMFLIREKEKTNDDNVIACKTWHLGIFEKEKP